MFLNVTILLTAYLLTVWVFRVWLKTGNIKNLSRTPRQMKKIALRTGLLYLLLWGICWYLKLNALKLLIMIAVVSLIMLGGGFFTLSPLAGIPIIIYYVLFQWILGFPDKELWIPPNKPYTHADTLTHLIGSKGYTETPLRPVGEISVEGDKYVATSEYDYVEKGCQVIVIAVKHSNLIVKTINGEKDVIDNR